MPPAGKLKLLDQVRHPPANGTLENWPKKKSRNFSLILQAISMSRLPPRTKHVKACCVLRCFAHVPRQTIISDALRLRAALSK
jgi:hypothetical protein